MKARQILIQDDCGEPHESFWCDATNCDNCVIRFQCYTSRSNIIITYALEEIDGILGSLNEQRWRLRDGTKENRTKR